MRWLYYWLSSAAYPLIWLWLQRRAKAGKEDPARLKERLGHLAMARPKGTLVWVHAASVGEANSVIPLIERLHNASKELSFVMTTGTVTSARLISRRLPERAYHHYVPVDVPWVAARFIRKLQPDYAVWVESEFWPNLLYEAHKRSVPMLLVNARLSQRSCDRWAYLRGSFQSLMGCFNAIYAGSQKDKQRLHQLGISKVEWAGNLKYDAAVLPADPVKTSEVLQNIGDRHVWLAASTHSGEEELVIDAHRAIREVFADILTIIVPRHPDRSEQIGNMLASHKLTYARRSKKQVILPETDVYLADTLGELGIFYRLSGVVLVGGSLVAHGGHNPIEAAQLDSAILCGPYMHNFSDVMADLKAASAIIQLTDKTQLPERVLELLREQDMQAGLAERAHVAVDRQRGAAERIAQRVLEALAIEPNEHEESALEDAGQ